MQINKKVNCREVELAPWLVEKKKRFLETLSEEDRAYKKSVDDAIKQRRRVAVMEKKRLSEATEARAAEARTTRQTVKAIDLAGKKGGVTEKRKTRETIKKVDLAAKRASAAEKKKAEKAAEKEKKKEKKAQDALAKKAKKASKAKNPEVLAPAHNYQPAPVLTLYEPITPPMTHSPPACLFDQPQPLPHFPQAFHSNEYPQSTQYHFPTLDFPFATPSISPEVFDPPF